MKKWKLIYNSQRLKFDKNDEDGVLITELRGDLRPYSLKNYSV